MTDRVTDPEEELHSDESAESDTGCGKGTPMNYEIEYQQRKHFVEAENEEEALEIAQDWMYDGTMDESDATVNGPFTDDEIETRSQQYHEKMGVA